jgi:RsiW-degrading membrane proteinase PrsW (M82 family)
MWSIHTIPQYNGSQPSTTYFDLPIDVPNIDILTIFTLLIISLIMSFLVLVQVVITPGCTGRSINRDGSIRKRGRFRHALRRWGTVWPLVVVGLLGFIFGLAGIIILRVQVSQAVDALMNASSDEVHRSLFYSYNSAVEEDAKVFWNVLGFAVALLGANPILLAMDGWFWPARMDSR